MGNHNAHHLIPAKKGDIRNPVGRVKGTLNRKTIFNKILALTAFEGVSKKQAKALVINKLEQSNVADQIAMAMAIKALDGDVAAATMVIDSACGKLKDKVDNTHSFNQMGRVQAQISDGKEAKELDFNIGKTPLITKDD